jgi:aspartate-semialdehyde dehydrogenase
VLDATGSVGQRFILLLALIHIPRYMRSEPLNDPQARNKEVVKWKQVITMSKELGELIVRQCKPKEFKDCDIIISGLDSDGRISWCACIIALC